MTGLRVVVPAPPAIVVGQQLVESDPSELRFLIGRALELTRAEYILGAAMAGPDFNHLFGTVLRAFHPATPAGAPATPAPPTRRPPS